MATQAKSEELRERERDILRHVVHNYIHTAVPIGSRFISKRFERRLSPATIRNVMADLEELGYLSHPHTSAGRVPTDLGYRYYVDFLMEVQDLSQGDRLQMSAADATLQLASLTGRERDVVLPSSNAAPTASQGMPAVKLRMHRDTDLWRRLNTGRPGVPLLHSRKSCLKKISTTLLFIPPTTFRLPQP